MPELLRVAERALAGDGVVLTTSGSTGAPKHVVLPAAAIRASAEAVAERIGGPGQWLLALPATHVGGWQVAVRSVLAGTVPTHLQGTFTPKRFLGAVDAMGPGPRFVSLVPTQVVRLVEVPAALQALASFEAVLVGGAPLPAPLLARLTAAGAQIHRTYGMTETTGGCIYDGTALSGVTAQLDDARVVLGGPVVADGYLGNPELTADRFSTDSQGLQWFRTDDVGEFDAAGRLRLLGRIDDVINSGGFKVAPRPVEEALLQLPGVLEAVVLGVPDAEWGQRVAAVLVGSEATSPGDARPDSRAVRLMLRNQTDSEPLPAHALPRQVLWLDRLPVLPSGKPDRVSLRHRCADVDGTMGPDHTSAD